MLRAGVLPMIPRLRVSLLLAIIVAAAVAACSARIQLGTLPHAYTLHFENDWVRVVRVHYAPHAKLPTHAHNELAAAYVYLNDGGPVVFGHIGASYGAATRPPTKAGSFRLYRAVKEVHEVENQSPLPSDFLRVEFKTDPLEAALLRGRYHREPVPPARAPPRSSSRTRSSRVTRVVVAPGKSYDRRRRPAGSRACWCSSPRSRLVWATPVGAAGDTLRVEAAAGAPADTAAIRVEDGASHDDQGTRSGGLVGLVGYVADC